MASFTLYHTDGCHLCEMADELLVAANVSFAAKDIMDSEQLIALYQTSIPVVEAHQGEKLFWPFDAQRLAQFIADNKE
ncbi:glutaredoxin family protein [Pseudoalteromonas sp. SSMSWG5]|jgi:glutaredoxin|uniref:glutaredoxin family protein n=1 Tax=Pseudoalteromonas TaxID=53246 RepID=UPI000C3E5ACA|nr:MULTISPECIES: glutaredoxin family protein [unclassified Pseudoalteromonas]MBU76253.1 thiol-disulfide isomerase [Pseudoalteromonadaceae bacterium]MCF2900766.1 glutaredoxin family protein [Pseudoalteromonas sp. OFAV1]MCF2919774.1 glutaredoxin family protein [Pseudoalteromonas sp. APAL1]MCO7249284.1 glutaredoxin family protein [Pseudoalteromonas sp. Ps84H-4]TMO44484.1 thiol-disulfide isomerase [Pseudoalteromonas sp. S4389]|tara:strand:+ start:431 stop:664 length:234 start_codon:yes stop_codon:yes gene_type:complete